MLVLGVPEYRLPREIIRAEIAAIESLGVEIRLNTRLGKDFAFADLKQQGFEAVFLGIGAHKSRELAIEGVQLDGVLRAIDFLLNVNLGYRVSLGRKVVVIGGGNVAFDVARSVVRQTEKFAGMSEAELRVALHQAASALEQLTAREPEAPDEVRLALDVAREAIRKGVPEVHMYCLESLDEIPAAREEIEEAEKEGIRLHTRFGPKRIVGQRRQSLGHRTDQGQPRVRREPPVQPAVHRRQRRNCGLRHGCSRHRPVGGPFLDSSRRQFEGDAARQRCKPIR